MATNISHLDNAQLIGQSKVDQYFNQWQDQFNRPVTEAKISMAINELPMEARQMLEQMAPDAMKALKERVLQDKEG